MVSNNIQTRSGTGGWSNKKWYGWMVQLVLRNQRKKEVIGLLHKEGREPAPKNSELNEEIPLGKRSTKHGIRITDEEVTAKGFPEKRTLCVDWQVVLERKVLVLKRSTECSARDSMYIFKRQGVYRGREKVHD